MGCSALIWAQTLLSSRHSSSTSDWSLFDQTCGHRFSGKRRNLGPCCHLSAKLRTGIPRKTSSATFSSPGICFHLEASVLVWIPRNTAGELRTMRTGVLLLSRLRTSWWEMQWIGPLYSSNSCLDNFWENAIFTYLNHLLIMCLMRMLNLTNTITVCSVKQAGLEIFIRFFHLSPGLNAVTNFANFAIFRFSFKFNKFCNFLLNSTRYTKICFLNDFSVRCVKIYNFMLINKQVPACRSYKIFKIYDLSITSTIFQ